MKKENEACSIHAFKLCCGQAREPQYRSARDGV